MPTYIVLTTLTDQGLQTLRANPDRLRAVNHDVEELGARGSAKLQRDELVEAADFLAALA